ncbi:HupE/UreJ family protein [Sorangium sp. So ce233]|uniref:HupE/UreJ family protein n=1 Tax=Sorangium sp. So ce233 TaxID=3133290 RepID=UPI003F5F6684
MNQAARRCRPTPLWISIALAIVALVRPASAHDPFEITTVGQVRSGGMDLLVTMTGATAAALVAKDGNVRGSFRPEQFAELEARLRSAALELYEVTSRGEKLVPRTAEVGLSEENEVEFRLGYSPPQPGPLRLRATHLSWLSEGYANAVNITSEEPRLALGLKVLTASDPELDAALPERSVESPSAPTTAASPAPRLATIQSFLRLGLEHIFAGYDHLLFLGGLLIGCRRVSSMLRLVTCFTVAHSLTLALTVLDVIVLPSRIVEPLIAASIVVVGLQNSLSGGEPKHRLLLTFCFGLVHGLGFAGALRDTGLGGQDGASIVTPLLSFNIGIELGQIALAAVALPALLKLQRLSHWPIGARVASLLVAIAGAFWLFERAVQA